MLHYRLDDQIPQPPKPGWKEGQKKPKPEDEKEVPVPQPPVQ